MLNEKSTRQAIAAIGKSGKLVVSGKLKTALDLMVWHGKPRDEAASTAGIKDHSLRAALKKPHVKAFYAGELDALRTGERARNVHALVDVRDSSKNSMARVAAAKALEDVAEAAERVPLGGSSARLPGIVIVIGGQPLPAPSGGSITIDGETTSTRRSSFG